MAADGVLDVPVDAGDELGEFSAVDRSGAASS
jgi:hypothetical protein